MDEKSEKRKGTDGSTPTPTRKGRLKFAPKVPRNKAINIVAKMEPQDESKIQKVDRDLIMKLKTPESMHDPRRRAKVEKNEAHIEVAFGQVNHSIARSFPTPKSSSSVEKEKDVHLLGKSMLSDMGTSAAKLDEEFAELQDFTYPSYNCPPITLPLRRPYSGDTEILDADEFGEIPSCRAQHADELSAAEELGLMDTDMMDKPQLLLFQFPASLPLQRLAGSVTETNIDASEDVESEGTKSKENGRKRSHETIQGCKLKDLPSGLTGKILVYKSGKVKMRIGDALFDVSAGLKFKFAQEAVAINTGKKHCCGLGDVSKRVIVTPDIDYLLKSVTKME